MSHDVRDTHMDPHGRSMALSMLYRAVDKHDMGEHHE